ncbi:hypothetical protein BZG36_00155 [Bifiguratus adelaidae]|uniref:FAD-dependent oxidoreductase domain-containing protein 1 n=1 Tax=Bifiguratus adelaidae TaxID=1938954 RepID=A0A261Y8W9_9FUNG|nr:hypothetical protein BZG36_00155 [Bifiguratus adelaidae]
MGATQRRLDHIQHALSLGQTSAPKADTSTADFDIVVVGAGLAGLNTAYALLRQAGTKNRRILIIERRESVMKETSSASTGGFRNYFPNNDAMIALANRSIGLLASFAARSAEVQKPFDFNPCGYVFFSKWKETIETYWQNAVAACSRGAGALRYNGRTLEAKGPRPCSPSTDPFPYTTYNDFTDGVDIIDDVQVIRQLMPEAISPEACVMMHVRKAGYLDAEGLGEFLEYEVERFPNVQIWRNTELKHASMDNEGKIQFLALYRADKKQRLTVRTAAIILAPGPRLAEVARLFNVVFPVMNEPQAKAIIADSHGLIPAYPGPFTVWSDPLTIPLTAEEREVIKKPLPDGTSGHWNYLESEIGDGLHCRPLSEREAARMGCHNQRMFAGIWTYNSAYTTLVSPPYPIYKTPLYGPIVLRGLMAMIPSLERYATLNGRLKLSSTLKLPKSATSKILTVSGANAGQMSADLRWHNAEGPSIENEPIPLAKQSEMPLELYSSLIQVKAGYYCKTPRNLPLLGPVNDQQDRLLPGVFVCGAWSGFGVMNGPGMAEIVAQWVDGYFNKALHVPWYASAFTPEAVQQGLVGFDAGRKEGQL